MQRKFYSTSKMLLSARKIRRYKKSPQIKIILNQLYPVQELKPYFSLIRVIGIISGFQTLSFLQFSRLKHHKRVSSPPYVVHFRSTLPSFIGSPKQYFEQSTIYENLHYVFFHIDFVFLNFNYYPQ